MGRNKVRTDHVSVVSIVNRVNLIHELHELNLEIFQCCELQYIILQVQWVPKENKKI